MFRSIQQRQISIQQCRDLLIKEELRRTYSLELSSLKHLASPHQKAVLALDFDSSDERFLLSGGLDGHISLFDLHKTSKIGEDLTFKPIILIKRSTHVQAPRSGVTSIVWNPKDTGLFMTGSFDKRACVWDTNELVMVHAYRFDSEVKVVKISPVHPQSMAAIGTGESQVSLCDLRLGNVVQSLSGHTSAITALAWSPGSEYSLVSGAADGSMKLWDLRKSNSMITFDYHKTMSNPKKRGRSGLLGPFDDDDDDNTGEASSNRQASNVATPSSSTASTSNSSRPTIVRKMLNPSANTRPETAHQGAVTDLVFLPCGTRILSTGQDHMMRLWDESTGLNQFVHYPDIRNDGVHPARIALSNNGAIVYHPRRNDLVALEVETGRRIHTLHGHFTNVTSCTFHKGMPELYSGASDGSMLVWTPGFDEERYIGGALLNQVGRGDARENAVIAARRRVAAGDEDELAQVADWNSDEDDDIF